MEGSVFSLLKLCLSHALGSRPQRPAAELRPRCPPTSESWKGFCWFTLHTRFGRVLPSASLQRVRPQLVASQNSTKLHQLLAVPKGLQPGYTDQWSAAGPGHTPRDPMTRPLCASKSSSFNNYGHHRTWRIPQCPTGS